MELNQNITNQDFEVFRKEVPWFFKYRSTIELHPPERLRLSEEFHSTFPLLSELIQNSRQTNISVNNRNYVLFAWDTNDKKICGWLNEQEMPELRDGAFIEKHELLMRNIGGIRESFNQPEESFTDNQDFLFLGSESSRGIGGWEDYYSFACTEEQKTEIDYMKLVSFAKEANGALTLYEPVSEKVLLFSHDHCYSNVEFMEDQPAYTFHTFKNADTFQDYVEELARQWLLIVKV